MKFARDIDEFKKGIRTGNILFKGIAATGKKSFSENSLRVANIKLKGRQYYNLRF